jgi:hypothetical protein
MSYVYILLECFLYLLSQALVTVSNDQFDGMFIFVSWKFAWQRLFKSAYFL